MTDISHIQAPLVRLCYFFCFLIGVTLSGASIRLLSTGVSFELKVLLCVKRLCNYYAGFQPGSGKRSLGRRRELESCDGASGFRLGNELAAVFNP